MRSTLYTWDLMVFDPSWFTPDAPPMIDRLTQQAELKTDKRVRVVSHACREFLELGGSIRFRDLTAPFLRGILRRSVPMLAGLSSTYLYRMRREYGPNDKQDDLRGEPAGHFVVLSGYHRQDRLVRVSDPYRSNPVSSEVHYWVNINRLISSVLLGNLTFDANILLITQRNGVDDYVNLLFVVNNPKDWPLEIPGVTVVPARAYLTDAQYFEDRSAKVFNLCRSYKYQSAGYYVSLLAAARGHHPLPSLSTIQDLRSPGVARLLSEDLEELMQRTLKPLHATSSSR